MNIIPGGKVSIVDLASMRQGEGGRVVRIEGGFGLRRRLEVLGVRVGVRIEKVSGYFMRGPVVVRSGNTEVAIGYGMARRIFVDKTKD